MSAGSSLNPIDVDLDDVIAPRALGRTAMMPNGLAVSPPPNPSTEDASEPTDSAEHDALAWMPMQSPITPKDTHLDESPSHNASHGGPPQLSNNAEIEARPEVTPDPEPEADWEEEIIEEMSGGLTGRSWEELRDAIKKDLKKHNRYTVSQINQLTIICNFANLLLKGYHRIPASVEIARQWHEGHELYFACRVRALARHYEVFGMLPVEKRGGRKNARCHLNDESVQKASRDWLTALPAGEVTPLKFQRALNETILPALNIVLKAPLCERTARRWLIKLGWRRTLLKKGVYMDGHERPDVVEYRQEVFLPAIMKFEARMTRYEGPDLVPVKPQLAPGEKEVMPQYHDESCLSVNDYKWSAW